MFNQFVLCDGNSKLKTKNSKLCDSAMVAMANPKFEIRNPKFPCDGIPNSEFRIPNWHLWCLYNAPMSWMNDEIQARGAAVAFDVFMELALYHPVNGYYSGEKVRYGRSGDFLTAPTASPWYSRVVARMLAAVAAERGPLRLVDLAAGDGSFLAGVLDALGSRRDEVLSGLVAVERSSAMRERVVNRFAPNQVECVDGVSSLGKGTGSTVIHASELYDAMPVVRVVGDADGLQEMWVASARGELGWEQRPARNEVCEYFQSHGVELEPGQVAEANLAAVGLHREFLDVAGEDGLTLILDYGYEARRLYNSRAEKNTTCQEN